MINCAWRNILTASFLSAFKYRAKRARRNSRERNGGNGSGGDDSGERCIEEHPVKGGRAAYPFNSRGVNDSRKKEKRRAAKMPKSQLARIYRFLPRGKRKLKLRFLLGEASRPSDGCERLAAPLRAPSSRMRCVAAWRGGDQRVRVRRAPCKLIRGWNKYYTALASASHCCLRCCRLRLPRELPMKVSPNERREGVRGRRNERDGRNKDRRGQNREQSADGNEEHGEPAASRFSKVRCFFPVFVPGSRDVSPSTDPPLLVPLSSVLVVRASWCPPVSPYTRHSSSLLSSLSLSPPRPYPFILLPFSILPSFMFLRPLSSLGCFHIDK